MERDSQNMPLEEQIFRVLYFAQTEEEVDKVIEKYPHIFGENKNWYPLGGNDSNFGVI